MALVIVAGLVAMTFIIATASAICTLDGNRLILARNKSDAELAKARILADPAKTAELAASEAKANAFQEAARLWAAHSDVRVK